ncbi:MAG: hypothetical protein KDC04_00615 [Saprospiraceae bacterium]|nr:hypothetical protein [Saprospiraceae bacterium]MCB9308430.1 hypothetical protein [Lewinellaceae bacterium]
MEQTIQLNVIPFTPKESKISIPVSLSKDIGFSSIFIDEDILSQIDDKIELNQEAPQRWLYTSFATPAVGDITLDIDLFDKKEIALHYFRHLIHSYFDNNVADVMRRNFTDDVEIWFKNTASKDKVYDIYYLFTLKVQFGKISNGFELVVSFDGETKVYKKSILELNIDASEYNWILNKNRLYKYEHAPDEVQWDFQNTYPVLTNKLAPLLDLAFERSPKENRYRSHYAFIENLYKKYLNVDAFRNIIPLSSSGFIQLKSQENRVPILDGASNILQFGSSTGVDPKIDLRKYGPAMPLKPPVNIKLFFIYDQKHQNLRDILSNKFINGQSFHPGINTYLKTPFHIDQSLDITFNGLENCVQDVYNVVHNRTLDPAIKYLAIYISPITKFIENEDHKKIYYRLKEMLLHHNYYSQSIVADNINTEGFKYFLCNIQAAILAKLGGVPWRLKRDPENELIIGIGAFYSISEKSRLLGSAFCFNNQGIFKNLRCFKSEDIKSLVGSIREAVHIFKEQSPDVKRLIIHFYKAISKKEVKEILNMLYNDCGLDIPIIIATINKTESKDYLGFDISKPTTLMPYSGTYIEIKEREYILFNNTRYDETSKPTIKEYHFPIKIKFTATDLSLVEDPETIAKLIDQIYQFSRMYWKSVSQQSLPVTISYPEMIARIHQQFKYSIPEFGLDKLWFL